MCCSVLRVTLYCVERLVLLFRVCCSVLGSVACCNVSQCVAVCWIMSHKSPSTLFPRSPFLLSCPWLCDRRSLCTCSSPAGAYRSRYRRIPFTCSSASGARRCRCRRSLGTLSSPSGARRGRCRRSLCTCSSATGARRCRITQLNHKLHLGWGKCGKPENMAHMNKSTDTWYHIKSQMNEFFVKSQPENVESNIAAGGDVSNSQV